MDLNNASLWEEFSHEGSEEEDCTKAPRRMRFIQPRIRILLAGQWQAARPSYNRIVCRRSRAQLRKLQHMVCSQAVTQSGLQGSLFHESVLD